MANSEHLGILWKGVGVWNEWRRKNWIQSPDLSETDLRGAHLAGANPAGASLSAANLIQVILSGANLGRANMTDARLTGADLTAADLTEASLVRADLIGANLTKALANGVNLTQAALIRANLTDAMLNAATLNGATLTRANLTKAMFRNVTFANLDLSEVDGLEKVTHCGPSSIGIDTLYRSGGQIPDQFLRDAGVPEEVIDLARSIRNGPPIQWHSCFISYSTKDEEFARRLHSRMREANMRVWFAPEDMKGGDKIHEQLFRAIQLHEKLLLVLSPSSMASEWVMTEIRKARETEKREQRRKLFPIRLAEFDTLRAWTCFDADSGKDLAVEVREYYIPDFSNWKDHDAFENAFKRLQADLKASEEGGSERAGADARA
jgi:hypothetical protein